MVSAERTAEKWHNEFKAAEKVADSWHDAFKRSEDTLHGVYNSIWWRMTAPLRWLADRVRRRGG